MKIGNVGTGILIAALAAVIVAVGMVVGNRMEKGNLNKYSKTEISESQPEENTDQAVFDGNVLKGDINNDGMINTADITAFSAFLKSGDLTSVNKANADINKDGKTDDKDFELLVSML